MIRVRLWLLLISLATPVVGLELDVQADQLADLMTRADLDELHEDRLWRGLLHYRQGRNRSELRPGEFFLSPVGHKNAAAELHATMAAAFHRPEDDPNQHVTCRYPARMKFLQDKLAWQPPYEPDCPDLQRWRRNDRISGISLVFVSGDMSNPASFFGHILMKFNESGDEAFSTQELSNRSVNFGALVPENENPVSYLVRGLVGGYPLSYSSTSYFEQRHDYGDEQLRDMWDYRLNLDADQVSLLVDHTWELQNARNTYYFLTRNCAYEFAQLLSLAVDDLSLPEIKLWSTPADLFEVLTTKTTAEGQPLLADVTLVASRQRNFRQADATLSTEEKDILAALLTAMTAGDGTSLPVSFQEADQRTQSRILEVALQYTRFSGEKFTPGSAEALVARRLQGQVALLRLQRPAGRALMAGAPDIAPPTEGHKSSLLQITPLSHSDLGAGLQLRLRPAYSDLLSLDAGALPYSAVSMGDLRILIRDDKVILRRLDLVSIEAFNISPTGLPNDKDNAWRFRIGAEDRDLSCDDCLVGFVEAGLGKSFPVGENAALAVFAQARGVTEDASEGAFEFGPNLNVVGSWGDATKFTLATRYLASYGMEDNERLEADFDIRFGNRQTSDMRFHVRYLSPSKGARRSEIGLSASFFF